MHPNVKLGKILDIPLAHLANTFFLGLSSDDILSIESKISVVLDKQQTLEEKHLGGFVVGILTKLVWSSIISITRQISYLYLNRTMFLPIQLYIICNGNLQIILMLPEN